MLVKKLRKKRREEAFLVRWGWQSEPIQPEETDISVKLMDCQESETPIY